MGVVICVHILRFCNSMLQQEIRLQRVLEAKVAKDDLVPNHFTRNKDPPSSFYGWGMEITGNRPSYLRFDTSGGQPALQHKDLAAKLSKNLTPSPSFATFAACESELTSDAGGIAGPAGLAESPPMCDIVMVDHWSSVPIRHRGPALQVRLSPVAPV